MCVQWAGYATQKRERKPCSSQRGKHILTRLEQQPNVKSDMRMSNCVLESRPQSKCFRRRCPRRYNEEASRTGGFFWVSYQQMKTANFLESARRQNMTLPSLKMVAAGGHVQQSQGTPGDEHWAEATVQKTHWRSQRTNSDRTGRHLYIYSLIISPTKCTCM